MFRTIRHWLILKLAGKDTIVINAIVDGEIKSHVSQPTLIAGCTFYQDLLDVLADNMGEGLERAYRDYADAGTHPTVG